MGYYMTEKDCNFNIKSENKDKAMLALHNLANEHSRLSWIEFKDVLLRTTFEDTISEFGWDVETDEGQNINNIDFM